MNLIAIVPIILLCVCCALLGSTSAPKPLGWGVVVLAIAALLFAVIGGIPTVSIR